jgi:aminotransferase
VTGGAGGGGSTSGESGEADGSHEPRTGPVSRRAAAFDSSGIRRVFDLAASLPDPINLSIGQPDFAMPEQARVAAAEAIAAGRNGYTPTQGLAALRDALEARVRAELGEPSRRLCVTSGTSGALVLALMALVDPGDEVVIFEPAFVMYRPLVEFLGGHAVTIDTAPSFRIDMDAVARAITPRCRVILLNTPANPTGVVIDRDTLESLVRLAESRGVTLVSDELYRSFCYDDGFVSPAAFGSSVVVLDGFSKSHAMTGWRVGWMHGPAKIVEACTTLQQYTFVCAPQVGQWAGLAALDCDMTTPLAECRRKRDRLVEALAGHYRFTVPGGAFYLYPEAPGGSGQAFADRAAAREQLLVVPGNVFGRADTHFRIAYTVPDAVLERGIAALVRLARPAG